MGRFRRSQRLLKPAEFQRVFKAGQRCGDRHFGVIAAHNDLGHARLGLAISRKIDRRAVGRNRLKRIVRAWFRNAKLPPVDLVVTGRGAVAAARRDQLWASLHHIEQQLWKRCAPS